MNTEQNTKAASKASKVIAFFAGLAVAAGGVFAITSISSSAPAPQAAVSTGVVANESGLETVAGPVELEAPQVVGGPELVNQ